MARYDQIALWKYVIEKTGREKIIFIGHSQGTIQMFAALCEHPEFFKRHLGGFIAVAPAVRIKNMESPMLNKVKNNNALLKTIKKLGPDIMQTANSSDPVSHLVVNSFFGQAVGFSILENLSDRNAALIHKEGYPNYMKFYPAGATYQELLHWRQLAHSGEFRKFKYETEEENIQEYGTSEPPLYDMEHIQGYEICLACGEGDLMISKKDYTWLYETIKDRNYVSFMEFREGHLGLLIPKNDIVIDSLFEQVLIYQTIIEKSD